MILGIGLLTFVNVGRTYIEGTISGSLSANSDNEKQDIQTFFIRVEEKGTFSVILKWKSASEFVDSEIKLRVFNMDGEEIKVYESSNSKFSYVNISDLGDKNYRDFKAEVMAYKGDAEYTLRVIKPGELVEGKSSNLIENIGWFNIKVVKDNSNTSQESWIRFKNLTKGLSTVKVKIFDKDRSRRDDHVFTFKDEEIDLSEISSKLLGGEYTLILWKLDNKGLNSGELMTSGLSPVDLNTNFLNRTIQSGQTDQYRITLNGEKFIWVVWDKVVRDQGYPVLEIVLTDMNGNVIKKADVLDANSTAVLVVDELRGSYNLGISSQRPAYYALGIENQNYGEYDLKVIDDYVVTNTLESGNMFIYDLQFEDTYEKTIDIVLKNSSLTNYATVTAGIDGKSESIEIEADSQKTITLKVIPDFEQKYQLWVKSVGGNVSYAIDCDYKEIDSKVTNEELIFDPTQLTYFSEMHDFGVDSTIERSKEEKILDMETLPLLVTKDYINESGNIEDIKSSINNLDKWELTPIENITYIAKDELDLKILREIINDENYKGEFNEIIAFKDSKDQYRLMVKWLTDSDIKVGTIKGYSTINGKDVLRIERDIIVKAFKPELKWNNFVATYKASKIDPWFQTVVDKIKLVQTGVNWSRVYYHNDNGKEYYTVAKYTSSAIIPFQLLAAQILQESSGGKNLYRYEPFYDSIYFGSRHYLEGYAMEKLAEHYSDYVIKAEVIENGQKIVNPKLETVFDYFWKRIGKNANFNKIICSDLANKLFDEDNNKKWIVVLNPYSDKKLYPPSLWRAYPDPDYPPNDTILRSSKYRVEQILNNQILIKEERIKKVKKYLEILLNYGYEIVHYWYEGGMNDIDDPTKFEYIWNNIGNVYNPNAESEDHSPDTWPTEFVDPTVLNMKNKFIKIFNEGLNRKEVTGEERLYVEIYLEIFVDFGADMADSWYSNYYNQMTSKIKELYDPTRIDYVWNNIGKTYKLNDSVEISLNPNSKSSSYSPEIWEQQSNAEYIIDLKNDFDTILERLSEKNLLDINSENLMAKKVLEYLIKYGAEETLKWVDLITKDGYNIIEHGYYDPEMSMRKYEEQIIKPFIRQEYLAASYGHLQVLVSSAYIAGYYRENGDDLSRLIDNPEVALEYGIRFLVTEKMLLGLNAYKIRPLFNLRNLHPEKWIQVWNKILEKYNGGASYPGEVREKELNYLRKVGID